MTDLYGVIGDPIGHSLSPLIHNGWFQAAGLNAIYKALHVPAGKFDAALAGFTAEGYRGLNVTLPHKGAALAAAHETGEAATAIGAANTLIPLENGLWRAETTDIRGFQLSLEALIPDGWVGKTVYVLGAGGSAGAVIHALAASGATVRLCNRTLTTAQTLITSIGGVHHLALGLADALADLSAADLVINTTSLGYSGGHFDLPVGNNRLFYDISYGAPAASTLGDARAKGWRTADGLPMLVAQAAESFRMWTGLDVDHAEALAKCRAAVESMA